ncbi:hypothetical protein H2200_012455 [Cladophialophora chaetospira]|uniref:Uncharacterized protein n=1 Tax=Cladophialophora chaetospira TaxID=386627 RepID=A0AA38WXV9_9EURO|nr:hypothetical protein H2200_012455 [Cladophialophora chaetospira]
MPFDILTFPALLALSWSAASAASLLPRATPKYTIKWSNCTDVNLPNLQCGTLPVPLDWSNPISGENITLFVSKIISTSPSSSKTKLGSLMWNPGGPGVTTSLYCQLIAAGEIEFFSTALYSHFDIICPDPTPVKCDPKIYNQMPQLFVNSSTSFQKLVDWNKAFGESCLNKTGKLLGHVDTTSAAHDLEALRLALNTGKMNWFGNSYGTQLGAAYAELYPENVRTVVLDGAVDHSLTETVATTTLSTTYEAEMIRWFEWCQASDTCPMHSAGSTLPQVFDNLIAEANANPIPAPYCVSTGTCQPTVTGYDMIFNAEGAFLSDPRLTGWPAFGLAINQSLSGNASLLSNSIQTETSNDAFSGIAIGCLDWVAKHATYSEHLALQQLGAVVAPHTLGAQQFMQYSSWCFNWPIPTVNPQRWLNQSQIAKLPAESVLIVNAEYDPETSYAWAQSLKDQFTTTGTNGDSKAVLVMRKGDGHTSYAAQGQAARVMDAFWVNRTIPANGTVVDS